MQEKHTRKLLQSSLDEKIKLLRQEARTGFSSEDVRRSLIKAEIRAAREAQERNQAVAATLPTPHELSCSVEKTSSSSVPVTSYVEEKRKEKGGGGREQNTYLFSSSLYHHHYRHSISSSSIPTGISSRSCNGGLQTSVATSTPGNTAGTGAGGGGGISCAGMKKYQRLAVLESEWLSSADDVFSFSDGSTGIGVKENAGGGESRGSQKGKRVLLSPSSFPMNLAPSTQNTNLLSHQKSRIEKKGTQNTEGNDEEEKNSKKEVTFFVSSPQASNKKEEREEVGNDEDDDDGIQENILQHIQNFTTTVLPVLDSTAKEFMIKERGETEDNEEGGKGYCRKLKKTHQWITGEQEEEEEWWWKKRSSRKIPCNEKNDERKGWSSDDRMRITEDDEQEQREEEEGGSDNNTWAFPPRRRELCTYSTNPSSTDDDDDDAHNHHHTNGGARGSAFRLLFLLEEDEKENLHQEEQTIRGETEGWRECSTPPSSSFPPSRSSVRGSPAAPTPISPPIITSGGHAFVTSGLRVEKNVVGRMLKSMKKRKPSSVDATLPPSPGGGAVGVETREVGGKGSAGSFIPLQASPASSSLATDRNQVSFSPSCPSPHPHPPPSSSSLSFSPSSQKARVVRVTGDAPLLVWVSCSSCDHSCSIPVKKLLGIDRTQEEGVGTTPPPPETLELSSHQHKNLDHDHHTEKRVSKQWDACCPHCDAVLQMKEEVRQYYVQEMKRHGLEFTLYKTKKERNDKDKDEEGTSTITSTSTNHQSQPYHRNDSLLTPPISEPPKLKTSIGVGDDGLQDEEHHAYREMSANPNTKNTFHPQGEFTPRSIFSQKESARASLPPSSSSSSSISVCYGSPLASSEGGLCASLPATRNITSVAQGTQTAPLPTGPARTHTSTGTGDSIIPSLHFPESVSDAVKGVYFMYLWDLLEGSK